VRVGIGQTQKFTAVGTYTDGTQLDITTQVTWSSSDISVATIDTSGVATPVALGTASIFATLGNISGSTTLTVRYWVSILFSNSYIDVFIDDLPTIKALGIDIVFNYDHGNNQHGSNHSGQFTLTDYDNYLDAANRAGLKVIIDLMDYAQYSNPPNYSTPDSLGKNIDVLVNRYKNHPALFGWYIADEPSEIVTSGAQLQAVKDHIRAMDPNHDILVINSWLASSPHTTGATPYSAAHHTMYSIDIYPVGSPGPRGGLWQTWYSRNAACVAYPSDQNVCTEAALALAAYNNGIWSRQLLRMQSQDAFHLITSPQSDKLLMTIQCFGHPPDVDWWNVPTAAELVEQYNIAQQTGWTQNGVIFWLWNWEGATHYHSDYGSIRDNEAWWPTIRTITKLKGAEYPQ
jgi:hypothetical protein